MIRVVEVRDGEVKKGMQNEQGFLVGVEESESGFVKKKAGKKVEELIRDVELGRAKQTG